MNRVVLTLNANGDIDSISADEPVEIYFNSPHTPDDRVYLYGATAIGAQHVQAAIGGWTVGHRADDVFGPLPPSQPGLKVAPQ